MNVPKGLSSGGKNDFSVLLKRYFITGLLVVVPIWGTYLVLKALFLTMDGVLGNLLKRLGIYYVPGFGILILLIAILAIGVFTTNIFGKKIFLLWENLLRQLPLVRNVYSLVKSIVDTVSFRSEQKEEFNRVVLIEYPRRGCYTIAFVTGEMRGEVPRVSSSEKILNVFVPTVPNPMSGFILLLPESEVVPLAVSVEEAMKMVFSAGLYSPVFAPEGADSSIAAQKR